MVEHGLDSGPKEYHGYCFSEEMGRAFGYQGTLLYALEFGHIQTQMELAQQIITIVLFKILSDTERWCNLNVETDYMYYMKAWPIFFPFLI